MLVVLLLVFLVVYEPPRVVLQLACRQLSLHQKVGRRGAHLAPEVRYPGFRNQLLETGPELVNLLLFLHQFIFQIFDFGLQLENDVLVPARAAPPHKGGDLHLLLLGQGLVLLLELLFFGSLSLEEHLGGLLFLPTLGSLLLEVLHQFHLFA